MSIIPDVHRPDLALLVQLAAAGPLDIRTARVEPQHRYKIDVRDPALTTIYINRDKAPSELATGLIEHVRDCADTGRSSGEPGCA
ncbi:hypothetical protein [Actinomycetospora sp. NBC_00405]|uniref:hypothetical protein n=1 Tax=Actinomycetospora sp. NBC_00405 TaxID=2975952 RepID=UPI002E230085